jgi:RHS repeat-associated protein
MCDRRPDRGINRRRETLMPVRSPSANIVHGLGIDEWLMRTDNAGTRHFATHALGSTVALLDGAGGIQTQYTYEPFGGTTTTGASTTSQTGFAGRENDGTGLHYFRSRYFSSALQRFTSEDPAGFADGPNLHSYVHNSPLNFTDPLGLVTIIWGSGGSLVGLTGVEASTGGFVSLGQCYDIGGFGSLGLGFVFNVSLEKFMLGFIKGHRNNLRGLTRNINVNVPGGGFSVPFAEGGPLGFIGSIGPGFGFSFSFSGTGIASLRGFLSRYFGVPDCDEDPAEPPAQPFDPTLPKPPELRPPGPGVGPGPAVNRPKRIRSSR